MNSAVLPGTGISPQTPSFPKGGIVYLTGAVLIGGSYN